MPKKVLFVCIHNSARSQMAEAFLNQLANGKCIAESAGLEPGILNPVVVAVMREIGIDLSHCKTHGVRQYIEEGRRYDYVITVCDEASAEKCPIFPGEGKRLHWPFADPSGFTGSFEEKLIKTRLIRDAIKDKVQQWLSEVI